MTPNNNTASTESNRKSSDIDTTKNNNNNNHHENNIDDTDKNGPGGPPGTNETDLVIREGFPALYIPSSDHDNNNNNNKAKTLKRREPLIDGPEPIPRQSFWSKDKVIEFNDIYMDTLLEDCETVFTTREKDAGQTYSAGQTFFLPAKMRPRCALEGIVHTIFQRHVQHIDPTMYCLDQSGAEWWTLVLDDNDENNNNNNQDKIKKEKCGNNDDDDDDDDDEEEDEDEIGLHFDADYELEDQAPNLLLHPRVATVTYLSDYGAPTLILNQKSPPPNDIQKNKLQEGFSKAWLSHPSLGKHTAFDGRLLHGAPSTYFPGMEAFQQQNNNNKEEEQSPPPPCKKQKLITVKKRVTLLVNIWLNHWVLDAALLDDEVVQQLKTPWNATIATATMGSDFIMNNDGNSNLKSTGEDEKDAVKPVFVWEKTNWDKHAGEMKKVKLVPSSSDPAGEDEIALCNHNVTIKYNATMEEFHRASAAAPIVELELEEKTIEIVVGEELKEEDDDDDDENEEEGDEDERDDDNDEK